MYIFEIAFTINFSVNVIGNLYVFIDKYKK